MAEWLLKFFDSINIFRVFQKHFWSILFFICILGWSLFIFPKSLFQTLQIEGLRLKYLDIIGATTFISSIGIFTGIVYKGYKFIKGKFQEKRRLEEQQKLLNRLTPVENEYLLKFIEHHSQTATFTLYDGVVSGLVEKGILYKPNSQSNMSGEQDFNMYEWVYTYLHKHQIDAKQGE